MSKAQLNAIVIDAREVLHGLQDGAFANSTPEDLADAWELVHDGMDAAQLLGVTFN